MVKLDVNVGGCFSPIFLFREVAGFIAFISVEEMMLGGLWL